jgi:hypothetical protein
VETHILIKLGELFGTGVLFPGVRSFESPELTVEHFWYAEFDFFDLHRPLFVANITGENWHKGVLLIPKYDSYIGDNSQSYLGMESPYLVDLIDWIDPVTEQLQVLNALPSSPSDHSDIVIKRKYKIVAYTGASELTLVYHGDPAKNKDFLKLWLATVDVVHKLISIYNSKEMYSYVNDSMAYKLLLNMIDKKY